MPDTSIQLINGAACTGGALTIFIRAWLHLCQLQLWGHIHQCVLDPLQAPGEVKQQQVQLNHSL